jgi:hypothetical protein
MFATAVIVAVLGICAYEVGRGYYKQWLLRVAQAPKRRGHVATKKARGQYVDTLIAEDIMYAIECRVTLGDITREEANRRYAMMASMLRNKDLYPKSNFLKILINERLKSGFYQIKPFIPGAKLFPHTPVPTAEVIDFGSKLRNRHAA